MTRYCIFAARPNGAVSHANSQFKMSKYVKDGNGEWVWRQIGWKTINQVSDYLREGHVVRTAKRTPPEEKGQRGVITLGALVELELRVSKNGGDFNISEMPED